MGLIFFPLWLVVFVFLSVILIFALWLWAIIHCLNSALTSAQKLFWTIIILVFNIFGALAYFIFSSVGGKMAKNIKGKRLFRSKKNRVIGGVCGGLGEYFDVDPTVIRLLWVLFIFFSFGAAILAYLIAWIITPEN
jgi:phage shock protein C